MSAAHEIFHNTRGAYGAVAMLIIVIDIVVFLKAIASRPELHHLVKIDQDALNRICRSHRK